MLFLLFHLMLPLRTTMILPYHAVVAMSVSGEMTIKRLTLPFNKKGEMLAVQSVKEIWLIPQPSPMRQLMAVACLVRAVGL